MSEKKTDFAMDVHEPCGSPVLWKVIRHEVLTPGARTHTWHINDNHSEAGLEQLPTLVCITSAIKSRA